MQLLETVGLIRTKRETCDIEFPQNFLTHSERKHLLKFEALVKSEFDSCNIEIPQNMHKKQSKSKKHKYCLGGKTTREFLKK